MTTLSIESWYKPEGAKTSCPIGNIQFHVSEDDHLRMETAEEKLHDSSQDELFLDVELAALDAEMPEDYGPLSDCQFRVYINNQDHRGHFHLVGHLAKDGGLVYSNGIMVESLT